MTIQRKMEMDFLECLKSFEKNDLTATFKLLQKTLLDSGMQLNDFETLNRYFRNEGMIDYEIHYKQDSNGYPTPIDDYGITLCPKGKQYLELLKTEKQRWHESHPIFYGILVAIFSAILSLIVGLILSNVDKQSKHQEQEELLKKIQNVNKRFDSLMNHQKIQ